MKNKTQKHLAKTVVGRAEHSSEGVSKNVIFKAIIHSSEDANKNIIFKATILSIIQVR